MEDQQPRVGLTDAVQAVRGELRAAMVAGSEEVRSAFALGSVELEFAIDFHPAADGRVQVLVLSADTDESEQPVRIHRLRMTLDKGLLPRPGYGAPPGLSGRSEPYLLCQHRVILAGCSWVSSVSSTEASTPILK